MFGRQQLKKDLCKLKFCRTLLLAVIIFLVPISVVADKKDSKTDNSIKKSMRIAFCESEPFVNYSKMTYWILKAMEESGLIGDISEMPYNGKPEDTFLMWNWLQKNQSTEWKVEFVGDAWFSIGNEIKSGVDRSSVVNKINNRLKTGDIDLVISMGSDAGKVLAKMSQPAKVMIFSASNPLMSGIVKNADISWVEGIWAHVDNNKFIRQLMVLKNVIEPKRLGVVYENSDIARTYSAIEDVEKIAAKEKISIERVFVNEPSSDKDNERYYEELHAAYETLATKIDAFYLTVASIEKEKLPMLLEPFIKRNIPVFSQIGADEVEFGALMSITAIDFKNVGRFGVDILKEVISGTPIEELPQQFESTPMIIINLSTAEKIGFKVPFEMLLVADQVFVDKEESKN